MYSESSFLISFLKNKMANKFGTVAIGPITVAISQTILVSIIAAVKNAPT